ncbi:MAG: hypothetical protein HZB21_05915, partial [Deltaproteobacteria bacterium]|nr:hypothetical protein [Deltaproteobacteria bacterium]
ILFSFLYLMWKLIKRPSLPPKAPAWRLAIFSIGALLPFALTCLALYLTGVFDRFWFWTFTYAREYVSLLPLVNGLRILKAQTLNITGSSPLIWAFTAAGASAILWDRDARGRYPFLLLFFLFSFFAVLPGLYFRGHYFILMLPASALLFGAAMGSIRRLFSRLDRPALKTAPLFLAAASVGLSLYNEREILFIASPDEVSRIIYGAYGPTPFPESIEIARYIKGHSKENDRIAVLGSEPQIYFYSNRPSATGYIYTYPMMEAHRYALKMQEEMIRDIESERPVFLVYVNIPRSWHAGKPAERLIFDWLERYIPEHYEAAGIADIISKDHTDYIWGDEAERRVPSSKYWVGVYRRKDMLNRGRP